MYSGINFHSSLARYHSWVAFIKLLPKCSFKIDCACEMTSLFSPLPAAWHCYFPNNSCVCLTNAGTYVCTPVRVRAHTHTRFWAIWGFVFTLLCRINLRRLCPLSPFLKHLKWNFFLKNSFRLLKSWGDSRAFPYTHTQVPLFLTSYALWYLDYK